MPIYKKATGTIKICRSFSHDPRKGYSFIGAAIEKIKPKINPVCPTVLYVGDA